MSGNKNHNRILLVLITAIVLILGLTPVSGQQGIQFPVADAGGPYEVAEGEILTLDGIGSYDPEGTDLTYFWDLDGDDIFEDALGVVVTYSWDSHGEYTVGLGVLNGFGSYEVDYTTVTVSEALEEPDAPLQDPTIEGIMDLVRKMEKNGEITKKGVAKSLIKKLEKAEKSQDKKHKKNNKNILKPFINQVNAQKGKHITPEGADELIEKARQVIEGL